jgi:hypothetical protein
MFVLGPLLAAVKLGFFRGVPWTQSLGFTLLTSFLLVEGLFLLAYFDMDDIRMGETALARDYGISGYETFERFLLRVDQLGGLITTLTTVWLVLMAIFTPLYDMFYDEVFGGNLVPVELALPLILLLSSVFGLFMMLICCVFLAAVVYVIYSIMFLLFSKYPRIGRQLSVVFPEQGTGILEGDGLAILGLLAFVANITLCVVAYRFFYDPSGTINPSTTGVFG